MRYMILLFFFFFLDGKSLFSQGLAGTGYLNYPLSLSPRLNGNFGEMRPNHFHMGLDLWTEGQQNKPVFAAADGHVSRIKIESGGFGRAIYLDHPNGMTTVYAHMNKFVPEVEDYLKKKQYEKKSWKIDLPIGKDKFPVKKGELIGYSGNTGASQGPHVHFEVRDSKTENCLNPLKLGFPLPDETPPEIFRIAFYDRDKSLYGQLPIMVNLTLKDGMYQAPNVIDLPFEKSFVAVHASDRMTGVPNQNGIFKAELLKDKKSLTFFEFVEIGYDKTRYLNGHIDYRTKLEGGPYLQMLFPPKNFGLGIYKVPSGMNHIQLTDSAVSYYLKVFDANGNSSSAHFRIRKKESLSLPRKGVNPRDNLTAGKMNVFDDGKIRFIFSEDAFYDDISFKVESIYYKGILALSPIFQIQPLQIPVHSNFSVSIKPNRSMLTYTHDRVLIKRTLGSKTEVRKAIRERESFVAQFRELGTFQLIEDHEPPRINAFLSTAMVLKTGDKIQIDVQDNLGVINAFNGMVDGKWIMFQPVGNKYVYTVDQNFPSGEHKLSVIVSDEAGNSTKKDWVIKRQ